MNAQTALRALRAPVATAAVANQSRSYAKATLVGRLGAAPVQRESSNGRVYFTYPLAVNRPPKVDAAGKVQLDAAGYPIRDTDWYTIFNFKERAPEILPQLEAGSLLLVDVELSTRTSQGEGEGAQPTKDIVFRETSHRVLKRANKEQATQ